MTMRGGVQGYAVAAAWSRLSEPAREPLDEADLSLIWEGQRFPPEALQTADGRAVEVVHPGRRGGGAGPDFVDAVVLLDGVERRGDVELHVRASAFRGHGHEADPAYGNIALHVVYRADETETALCGGGRAPVAAFEPWLSGRATELESWLAAPEMWQEPCRGAVDRLGEAAVREALGDAGRLRFEAKTRRMAAEAARLGAGEALWRALLDALGVGGDREGFRRLAEAFPAVLAESLPRRELAAALLCVAGLGDAPPGPALPEPLRPGLASSGRPANRPQARLAGLATLVARAASGQAGKPEKGQAAGKADSQPSGRAGRAASGRMAGQAGERAKGQAAGEAGGPAAGQEREQAGLNGAVPGLEAAAAGVQGVEPLDGQRSGCPPTLPAPAAGARRHGSGSQRTWHPAKRLPAETSGPLAEMARASVVEAAVEGGPKALLTRWQVAGRDGAAPIGPDRARELVVNAVLPFAAASGLREEALRLLAALPAAPAYGKTAFLERNLRPEKGRIAKGALEQQGLLGYVSEWCSRGGCGRCPLSPPRPQSPGPMD